MTLFKLAASLPNGLHDAEITDIWISYTTRLIRLTLNIWVGDLDAPAENREEYRPALIELYDFEYFILDRPDAAYPYRLSRVLTIDLVPPDPFVDLEASQNECRLWVSEWNGFIHLCAGGAVLSWTGPSTFRLIRDEK